MRLTRTLVGRSTWTVVVSIALLAACSGDTEESVDPGAATAPAPAPETTPSTEPAPATTADTTTTIIETTTTGSTTTTGEQPTLGDWEPLDPASGRWLAFSSSRTGQGELFAVDVGSGTERQLTAGIGRGAPAGVGARRIGDRLRVPQHGAGDGTRVGGRW